MLDARYRKRVFRTIKKISLHDILTFDTGLPRFDLSLSCRINASYRSKRGLHEYKKELRINAEFNYQLSLSLSVPFPVETRAQSKSLQMDSQHLVWRACFPRQSFYRSYLPVASIHARVQI